jgi:hypothetical protein
MPTYNRTIQLTEQELTEVDLALLYPFNRVIVTSTLPAWFVDNTIFGYSSYWQITPPLDGTYTYEVDVYSLDEPTQVGTGTITLNVADQYENVNNCCSDENVNIVWLNRQGGRSNFIFTQRKDFNVDVGGTTTFVTNNIKKFSEIRDVYDGAILYSTGLSKNAVNYLDTLRYTIQAWIFNSDNSFTPIIIDVGSFTKYTTKEKLYEVQISFQYATRLNIQKQ